MLSVVLLSTRGTNGGGTMRMLTERPEPATPPMNSLKSIAGKKSSLFTWFNASLYIIFVIKTVFEIVIVCSGYSPPQRLVS